jgi:hypothetical protein
VTRGPPARGAAFSLAGGFPEKPEHKRACASDDTAGDRNPHAHTAVVVIEHLLMCCDEVLLIQSHPLAPGSSGKVVGGSGASAKLGDSLNNRLAQRRAPRPDITAPPTLSHPILRVSTTTRPVRAKASTGRPSASRTAVRITVGPRIITMAPIIGPMIRSGRPGQPRALLVRSYSCRFRRWRLAGL